MKCNLSAWLCRIVYPPAPPEPLLWPLATHPATWILAILGGMALYFALKAELWGE